MLNSAIEWLVLAAQRRRISKQFTANIGRVGDFENPKSYQEKIQFRKLYGNHAFYALAADKYRVRDYVTGKIGEQCLIPLLGAYDRFTPADFDALPQRFIIKANHGCKWHEVVYDKSAMNVDKTIRRFNTLVKRRYGWTAGERHYNFIPPKIVVEQLLQDDLGGLPWDYNFFCYNSPQGFDYSFAISSPDGKSASFSRDWELRRSNIPENVLALRMRPGNFDEMLRVARVLSSDFDFVRVDLYSVAGQVYFGELTCTPHQGYGPIPDEAHQKRVDAMWHLDSGNTRLYHAPRSHRLVQPAASGNRAAVPPGMLDAHQPGGDIIPAALR